MSREGRRLGGHTYYLNRSSSTVGNSLILRVDRVLGLFDFLGKAVLDHKDTRTDNRVSGSLRLSIRYYTYSTLSRNTEHGTDREGECFSYV